MIDAVIVLSAGPTSPKFGAYCADSMKPPPLLCRVRIDSMRGNPHFAFDDKNGKPLDVHAWGQDGAIDHKTALQFVIICLESIVPASRSWR